MLKDNRLEKHMAHNKQRLSSLEAEGEAPITYTYSKPKLRYFIENTNSKNGNQKNSFKLFQAMTLGDTSDSASIHSILTPGGTKYKPKIFEILKKHSRQS
jgi:hypothetical protein